MKKLLASGDSSKGRRFKYAVSWSLTQSTDFPAIHPSIHIPTHHPSTFDFFFFFFFSIMIITNNDRMMTCWHDDTNE